MISSSVSEGNILLFCLKTANRNAWGSHEWSFLYAAAATAAGITSEGNYFNWPRERARRVSPVVVAAIA